MTTKLPTQPEQQWLQEPCTVCGKLVDVPAVMACPCGEYRLCGRSRCHFRQPAEHRERRCQPPAVESEASSAPGEVVF